MLIPLVLPGTSAIDFSEDNRVVLDSLPDDAEFVSIGFGYVDEGLKPQWELLTDVPPHEQQEYEETMRSEQAVLFLTMMAKGDFMVLPAKGRRIIGAQIESAEIIPIHDDKCESGFVSISGWSDGGRNRWRLLSKLKNVEEAEELMMEFSSGLRIVFKIITWFDLSDPANQSVSIEYLLCCLLCSD
jgi:hypothetical protein